eukprot:gene15634-17869_t
MKAWQFGNKRPLLVDIGKLSFMEENDLLPANLLELVANERNNIIQIEQFFLAEVSKIAVIPYPGGTEFLHTLWKSLCSAIQNKTTIEANNGFSFKFCRNGHDDIVHVTLKSEELNLKHEFAFAAKIYMLPVSLFKGFNTDTPITLAAKFSLAAYSKPYNRFSLLFGATCFSRVSFEFPHIQLADIIGTRVDVDGENPQANAVRRQVLQYISSHMRRNPVGADNLWTYVKRLKYLKVADFVSNYVGKKVTFCGQDWSLISCNIAGALKYTYMYTSLCRSSIAGQLFANLDGVWNDSKPMLLALRLGLFNSTAVESSCLTDSDWEVHLVSDITASDAEGKSVELNDGCGWISVEAAKVVHQQYGGNWFSKVPVTSDADDVLVNINLGLEGDFLMVSDLLDICPDWPSRDLPPPDKDYVPSAFQIRFRGFKGMLVVSHELKGRTIQFTKSMKKFDSCSGDSLFIVGVSAPAHPTILSSELITMFEGATSDQPGMLDYLAKALIESRVDNGGNSLVSLLRNPADFLRYMGDSDDAIMELTSSEDHHLSQSKHFATRIMNLNVPLPNSAHVYGVADFSQTLKSNEVYLSVSNHGEAALRSAKSVVITKTPAMLKTHMRVFNIVHECPQLSHLRDVLVFSTTGNDLVTKQLSGADLDGDHFYVFWDEALVDLLNMAPPADATLVVQKNEEETKAESNMFLTQPVTSTVLDWAEKFGSVQTALVVPANSFEYCSLQHLLCLRRLFIDYFGDSWPAQNMSSELSQWITTTFEAPKHGKWLAWDAVRHILDQQNMEEILKFPHYYPGGSVNTTTRISTLLYAKLSDKIWNILSSTECWDRLNPYPAVGSDNMLLAAWISNGALSLDVHVRSNTNADHYGVEGVMELFPFEYIEALNDSEAVVNFLVLKAPIISATCTTSNLRNVAHAIEQSLLTPQMYRDNKFLYPNLFSLMTELSYDAMDWTDQQFTEQTLTDAMRSVDEILKPQA